jgi:pilus assembly protein CpaB
MKSTRAIVMILLSLIAGVAAVILAAQWVGQQAAENTTPVVVASRDLDLGTPLSPAMVQVVPWPSGAVPAGSFKELKQLEGRVARSPAFKGEPILEAKLAPQGTKGGLNSIIPGGKRAISVRVNEVVGVAGFALPGSYVDIMVNTRDSKDSAVSKIVLKRILVLAVAQEANRDETKPKVVNAVTLEVTPEEAEKIDLARSIGSLSLVLRNSIDQQDMETAGVRRDDLLGKDKVMPVAQAAAASTRPVSKPRTASVAAPRPAPRITETVEVIRGVQKANSEF